MREGSPMAPSGPRPPGPEKMMPQGRGSDREMGSVLPSGDLTNCSGEVLEASRRDAGRLPFKGRGIIYGV